MQDKNGYAKDHLESLTPASILSSDGLRLIPPAAGSSYQQLRRHHPARQKSDYHTMSNEVEELIKKGEGQNTEFKDSLSLKREIGETVSAFLFSDMFNSSSAPFAFSSRFLKSCII